MPDSYTETLDDAWKLFCDEMACVDDEYLHRAFTIAWNARGNVDRRAAARRGADGAAAAIGALNNPFEE